MRKEVGVRRSMKSSVVSMVLRPKFNNLRGEWGEMTRGNGGDEDDGEGVKSEVGKEEVGGVKKKSEREKNEREVKEDEYREEAYYYTNPNQSTITPPTSDRTFQ